MCRKLFRALSVITLLAYLLLPATAQAHETVTFGDYSVLFGWEVEPPVAGQPNAISLTITEGVAHSEGEAHTEGDTHADANTLVLVSPVDGAEVQGDSVEVSVALEGDDSHGDGEHWHLYVDEALVGEQEFDQPTYTVTGLAGGEHVLSAKIADANHNESDTAATATIHVKGSAADSTAEPAAADDHEHGAPSSVDVSGMTIEIAYGGEKKVLSLEPVFNGAPGEYLARVTPSRAGRYSVRLGGQLGDTPVSAEVEPQEVLGAEVLAFPASAGTASGPASAVDGADSTASSALTIAIVSLVTGLLGLGVGAFAVVRRGK